MDSVDYFIIGISFSFIVATIFYYIFSKKIEMLERIAVKHFRVIELILEETNLTEKINRKIKIAQKDMELLGHETTDKKTLEERMYGKKNKTSNKN